MISSRLNISPKIFIFWAFDKISMNNLFCKAKNVNEKNYRKAISPNPFRKSVSQTAVCSPMFTGYGKAISPLIATVLLIAFTLTVATILANWVSTFIKTQTEEVGEKSTVKIKCAFGSLEIDTAKYNNTNTRLLVILKNQAGDTDLQNITFSIILKNSSTYAYPTSCNCGDETLYRGETKAYSNSSIQNGCSIDKVIVTTNCPDAKDDVSASSIDFSAC